MLESHVIELRVIIPWLTVKRTLKLYDMESKMLWSLMELKKSLILSVGIIVKQRQWGTSQICYFVRTKFHMIYIPNCDKIC